MRLRPEHLVIAVGLVIAALVGYAVLFRRVPDVALPSPVTPMPAEPGIDGTTPSPPPPSSLTPGIDAVVPPPSAAPPPVGVDVPPPPVSEPAPSAPTPPTAAAPVATGPAPVIELATLEYDMGTIPNDKPSNGAIPIFNRGEVDLTISRVTASCPCTASKVEPPVIPPGGETPLTVVVDPGKVHGFESTQHVIVWSDDPKNPHIAVKVKAKIDPEFIVEPAKLDLGQVAQGQTAKARITVRQASDRPVEIASVNPFRESPGLTVALEKRPEAEWATPGRPEYVVDLSLDTAQAVPGAYTGSYVLETTVKRLRLYACAVTAEIVAATPAAGPASEPENGLRTTEIAADVEIREAL